jgi:hypothetical protein
MSPMKTSARFPLTTILKCVHWSNRYDTGAP